MGAVGASLTTDLVDLISARSARMALRCPSTARAGPGPGSPAGNHHWIGCSGVVLVLLLELRGAGACSAAQCPPLLDLWCGLVENTTTRHALRPGACVHGFSVTCSFLGVVYMHSIAHDGIGS